MSTTDDRDIAGLVPAILRDGGLTEPRSVVRERLGVANHVYRVDDRYTVRIGTGSDGPQFPKSTSILKAIEGGSIGPKLLHADCSRTRCPYNVMVCERLPGVALAELWPTLAATEKRRYAAEISGLLRRLHRYGAEDVPFFADVEPWPERFREKLQAWLVAARRECAFPAERLDRVEDRVRSTLPALAGAPPDRLVHLDVHWQNVVVHEGRVVSLLDFDDADIAPPELDAWELLFALTDDGAMPPPEAVAWLHPLFPEAFASPGFGERFILCETGELLWGLTQAGGETWTTVEQARAESEIAYHRLYESDFYEPWLRAFEGE